MNGITLESIVAAESVSLILKSGKNPELWVNKEKVWDYKDQDGFLRLIHEPVPGSDTYGTVTLNEIADEFKKLPLASETTGDLLVEVDLLRIGKGGPVKYVLNLKTKSDA